MINMTGTKLSIFSHPGKITGYWITTRSFPYRGPYTWAFPYWPGYYPETLILARDGVECQYGSRDNNQANMEMPMYSTIYYTGDKRMARRCKRSSLPNYFIMTSYHCNAGKTPQCKQYKQSKRMNGNQ
jgi:hypothetical protein